MATILISAAHTKENPGAIHKDLREADLTRKILAACIKYLDAQKIDYLTVPLDLPLIQRIDWINKQNLSVSQGDIFVEIHINDGGKRGVEAWYRGNSDTNNRSEKLAKFLSESISHKNKWTNQGHKSEYQHELGSLLILNGINLPGVAIELLFIDNEEDIKILRDEQQIDSLAKDLVDFSVEFTKKFTISSQEIEFFNRKVHNQFSSSNDFDFFNDDLNDTFANNNTAHSLTSLTKTPPLPTNLSINSTSYIPSLSASTASPTVTKTENKLMDRDQRKEMIIQVYKKILARDATQTEINTHLNAGVAEIELINKLIEGDEFKKIQEKAKNFDETAKQLKMLETNYLSDKKNSEDSRKIIENLNKLLNLKNQFIAQMQNELEKYKVIVKGEYYDANRIAKKNSDKKKILNSKSDIIDKIVKLLRL